MVQIIFEGRTHREVNLAISDFFDAENNQQRSLRRLEQAKLEQHIFDLILMDNSQIEKSSIPSILNRLYSIKAVDVLQAIIQLSIDGKISISIAGGLKVEC